MPTLAQGEMPTQPVTPGLPVHVLLGPVPLRKDREHLPRRWTGQVGVSVEWGHGPCWKGQSWTSQGYCS